MNVNGRYRLLDEIGEGGMGIVHRAVDRLTGEIVALKQIHIPAVQVGSHSHPDSTVDRNLRVALAQEFQILSGLRHPHIISVLDYGFDVEQRPFFTMTYLHHAQTILEAGGDLDKDGKIELVQQMLQALAYLHRRDILHRDLKPSNVLVTAGTVRVLDFGLSVPVDADNYPLGGSLWYMAPELLRRETASIATDLYALGVMAYELFAGKHPFDVTSGRFASQVIYDEPDLTLLGLDQSLALIIGRLLSKEPQDRYPRAGDCLNAISTALGEAFTESSAIRESHLQAAAFVGRETEMAQLQTALEKSQSGDGMIWLIGGESGVGKSRLLEEFRAHALVSGWQVLTGQAVAEGGLPFQLWREIVPNLVLNCELSDLEAGILRQIAPNVEQLIERAIPEPPKLEGPALQQRLILTLVMLLRRQPQPTLLLLEDLQWAVDSIEPLKQILRVLEQMRQVMVVASYRIEERPTLPEELPNSQHLILNRLNATQIAALSRAMLGNDAITSDIVAFLTQETEGNTFFYCRGDARVGRRSRTAN